LSKTIYYRQTLMGIIDVIYKIQAYYLQKKNLLKYIDIIIGTFMSSSEKKSLELLTFAPSRVHIFNNIIHAF